MSTDNVKNAGRVLLAKSLRAMCVWIVLLVAVATEFARGSFGPGSSTDQAAANRSVTHALPVSLNDKLTSTQRIPGVATEEAETPRSSLEGDQGAPKTALLQFLDIYVTPLAAGVGVVLLAAIVVAAVAMHKRRSVNQQRQRQQLPNAMLSFKRGTNEVGPDRERRVRQDSPEYNIPRASSHSTGSHTYNHFVVRSPTNQPQPLDYERLRNELKPVPSNQLDYQNLAVKQATYEHLEPSYEVLPNQASQPAQLPNQYSTTEPQEAKVSVPSQDSSLQTRRRGFLPHRRRKSSIPFRSHGQKRWSIPSPPATRHYTPRQSLTPHMRRQQHRE